MCLIEVNDRIEIRSTTTYHRIGWWEKLNRKTGEPNSAENIGFHRLKQTNRANKKTNQKTKNKKTKQQKTKRKQHTDKKQKQTKNKNNWRNAGFVLFLVLFLLFMVNLPVGLFFWWFCFWLCFFRFFANISWGLKGKSMKCDGKNHGFRLRFSLKPIQWEHSVFPFPRRIRWWRTYWPPCWSRRWAQFQGGGATENGMTSYNSTTKGRFFTLFDVSSLIFFLMSLNGRVAVFKDRVYAPHRLNISGATSKTSRFSDDFSTTNGSDTYHDGW